MTMPEEFYRTGRYSVDHSTFGGIIYQSDFNMCRGKDTNNGSEVASRIISDWNFDKDCIKDKLNKENYNNRTK